MSCSKHISVPALALLALFPLVHLAAQSQNFNQSSANTTVNLRWGARPGVSRYRLQLSIDREFTDIVFDRVVNGNQTQVNELPPGKYFWRIAPLTVRLGEFSSAGVVEVSASNPRPAIPPVPVPTAKDVSVSAIKASGGWRAAIGEVGLPVLAHLRRSDRYDIVVTNSDGVTYALDAVNGVALWTVRASRRGNAARAPVIAEPLIVRSRSNLDNVVVLAGASVVKLEGATGRELWRATLPVSSLSAIAIIDQRTANIVAVDASLQRLFILSDSDGAIVSQIKLPRRIVGKPMAVDNIARGAFALAYDNGQIEIRDTAGTLIRSGSTGSDATTPPIIVQGHADALILVGTRDGLTALTADNLQPLGRVALNNDAPCGVLTAQDLDGDGAAEVLMTTMRGHVVAVNAADGKVLWDVAARNDNGTFAFSDLNKDRVVDVLTTDGQTFLALSGRDGSVIWKDTEPSSVIANHTTAASGRALIAIPLGSTSLIIVNDPGRSGLRAFTFINASVRPTSN